MEYWSIHKLSCIFATLDFKKDLNCDLFICTGSKQHTTPKIKDMENFKHDSKYNCGWLKRNLITTKYSHSHGLLLQRTRIPIVCYYKVLAFPLSVTTKYSHSHGLLLQSTRIPIVCYYKVLTFPLSVSLFVLIHSTRFNNSLQDMVCMLLGRLSSWTFFEKRFTASDRSFRDRDWRTWWTKSASVLYARGL